MRILISPAKKMKVDPDGLPHTALPGFLPKTQQLLQQLQQMPYPQLQKLWNCNPAIATAQFENLQKLQLEQRLTPAILAYEGIQYKYMAPQVFTQQELDYVQSHLRIVSGFYGLLRPLDGVAPYRLEMQAKLKGDTFKTLYEFWGSHLATWLEKESNIIVNLASKEYSKAIQPHLAPNTTFVTCVFGSLQQGKVVEKGTFCKMARGEMVRFLAQTNTKTLAGIQKFNYSGYQFSAENSTDSIYTFIQEESKK